MRKVIFKNLGAEYLEKSLLKNGLFSDKLVPIFSGTDFADFVLKTPSFVDLDKNTPYNAISHRIVGHKNSYRTFKIPHPKPYAILCREIRKSWDKIAEKIETNWQNKNINTLHVRKMSSKPECVFCMDYSSRIGEISDVLLTHAMGKKYMIRADISNFFPSLYSHSIAWSAVGRQQAFKDRDKKTLWYNRLDVAVMNCQEKESIGLPIGPHTSNIISDMILSGVDKRLLEHKYDFVRYIDDYQCFADSKDRAEEFLVLLSDELAKIRLNLNRSKTKIIELPHVFDSTWPNRIRDFNFSKRKKKTVAFDDKNHREILSFLDFIVELHKKEDDAAILRYAIKMLRNCHFSPLAFDVYEKYVKHLILLYPYLSDFVYDIYASSEHYPKDTTFIEILFDLALKKKLNASISRVIYACMVFNLQNSKINENIENILKTEDSVSITALMLYCIKYKLDIRLIIDFAKRMIQSGRTDEYWVLVYELFLRKNLKKNDIKDYHGCPSFEQLKNGNVSFVNWRVVAID